VPADSCGIASGTGRNVKMFYNSILWILAVLAAVWVIYDVIVITRDYLTA